METAKDLSVVLHWNQQFAEQTSANQMQLRGQQQFFVELHIFVFSAVHIVSELEEKRDGGCSNCWLHVDVILLIFSCTQSRTVFFVEAFVSNSWHPIKAVCVLHGVCMPSSVSVFSVCQLSCCELSTVLQQQTVSVCVFVCSHVMLCSASVFLLLSLLAFCLLFCFFPFCHPLFSLSASIPPLSRSTSCQLFLQIVSTRHSAVLLF